MGCDVRCAGSDVSCIGQCFMVQGVVEPGWCWQASAAAACTAGRAIVTDTTIRTTSCSDTVTNVADVRCRRIQTTTRFYPPKSSTCQVCWITKPPPVVPNKTTPLPPTSTQPMNRRDVRVVERGQHLRFPLEPGQPLRVVHEGVGEDLQGDITVELGVTGLVDLAHPAATQWQAPRSRGVEATTAGIGPSSFTEMSLCRRARKGIG